MKIYVLMLSKVFPATHSRKGELTGFKDKFLNAINGNKDDELKLHTLRANYDYWAKIFEQIERGEACLSIRQWEGRPYASKQVEIAKLTKEDGIGLQKLYLYDFDDFTIDGREVDQWCFEDLAHNDGLNIYDWEDWFIGYDKSKPLAVIHFTNFRY